MYLKNLTVLGFKSFADRTSFNFEPGITAIVGPNGCGKSNVADAIRWVLGEQSAKALRGGEMADVIFNGTDRRKAIGMAEVSLTIGEIGEEQLRAAGVPIDFEEVTITRRVFRDGGSDYFINKTPTRLKDIQQLFMGTGVGRASYSIMAQGNITQVLSSKPEDRRMIFEEAAGITRFKAQKREALRKIDHTEQNLLRVQDLVQEVKRQIGSLQRQAAKARRYQKLQSELERLDTQLARHEHDGLQARIGEARSQSQRLLSLLEEKSALLSRREEELRGLRQEQSRLEERIHRSQQEGLDLKNRIDRHAGQAELHRQRIGDLEAQGERALEEIRTGEQRREQSRQELGELERRLEEARGIGAEREAQIRERQDRLEGVDAALRQAAERQQDGRDQAAALSQRLSGKLGEISALDIFEESHRQRQEQLSTEKARLEEERQQLVQRLSQFSSRVEARRREAAGQKQAVEERESRLSEQEASLGQVSGRLEEQLREYAEERSRLAVLEQLDADREGFGEAAAEALSLAGPEKGSLADRIRVADPHLQAIEAALGHSLQAVLAADPEAAARILERIRSLGKGRAGLAALEALAAVSSPAPPEAAELPEGAIGALEAVEAEEEVAPLVRSLLRRTLLVPDLEAGWRIWKERPWQYDLATPEGDLLTRHGICFAGEKAEGGSRASSILGRKSQIRRLGESTRRLKERIQAEEESKALLEEEAGRQRLVLARSREELREAEVSIATDEREHEVLLHSQEVLEKKIETVRYEIQSLAEQAREKRLQRGTIEAEAEALRERAEQAESGLGEIESGLEELRGERDRAHGALTEIRVAHAASAESLAALERQKVPLERRIGELEELVEQRRADILSLEQRRKESEAEIAANASQGEALESQRAGHGEAAARLEDRKRERQEGIDAREREIASLRSGTEEARQERHGLEMRLTEFKLKAENIAQRISEKYQKNLGEVAADRRPDPGEGPEAAEGEPDWEEVASRVGELQRKVDSMGPVNMVAIEEYEESEQRFEFLSGQHDELVRAKNELHEVLGRINTQTREMFHQTFNQIRENFRALFQEIFGGGYAELRLTDESQVLESGIEIVARPPGKRLQNISLLSGGEQTMTAVALLFSIYQVRPSPFCVLDELDAPLDESNINRFIQVLKRFLEYSQFVIITHNKRTIETADILYGVTMEERGVSRLVSVRFHPEEEGDPGPPAGEPAVAGGN